MITKRQGLINIRYWILYPFLFAIQPITSLLAYNLNQATLTDPIRATVFVLILTVALMFTLNLLLKDWHRTALITSISFILFFSYGHIARFVIDNVPASWNIKSDNVHLYLTSIVATVFILSSWWLWRVLKRDIKEVTRILNIVVITALFIPIARIIVYVGQNAWLTLPKHSQVVQMESISDSESELPDIYYIVLDGYTRADVLEDVFNYDNSEFIQFLTDNGFYVASQSHSNYVQTSFSLASTLNLEYVNYVTEQVGIDSQDREPLTRLIQNSEALSFLKNNGYQIVAITSGWSTTEFKMADVYISSGITMLNEFEILWLQNTLLGTLYSNVLHNEIKQLRIPYIFDSLKATITIDDQPKFVFAHITSPHIPLVFNAQGEEVVSAFDYAQYLAFPDAVQLAYIGDYGNELTYLNQLVMETVTEILSESEHPPIIIIQGDHGSRAYLDWLSMENSCLKERLSILNAYYFPENDNSQLYESITPVNSFRLLFDGYFDANYGLLEDEFYYSTWTQPYDLTKVGGQVDLNCSE